MILGVPQNAKHKNVMEENKYPKTVGIHCREYADRMPKDPYTMDTVRVV